MLSTFFLSTNILYSAYNTYSYLSPKSFAFAGTSKDPTGVSLDPVLKTAMSSNRSVWKRVSLLIPGYMAIGYLLYGSIPTMMICTIVGSIPAVSSFISDIIIVIREKSQLHPDVPVKILTNFIFVALIFFLAAVVMYQQSEEKTVEKLLMDYKAKNDLFHQELQSKADAKPHVLASKLN